MARMIDADAVKFSTSGLRYIDPNDYFALAEYFMKQVKAMPTLTPPNEPLTLLSMSDELPPDNERVLVYRPCMVDSDTGPYSVQWGWAAKRDGSHWAHLPDRRPPEGEEDT